MRRLGLLIAIAISACDRTPPEPPTQPVVTVVHVDGSLLPDGAPVVDEVTRDDLQALFERERGAIAKTCAVTAPESGWLSVRVVGDGTLSVTSARAGAIDCAGYEMSKLRVPRSRFSGAVSIKVELP